MPRDGYGSSLRGFSHKRDIANDLQEISKTLKHLARLMEMSILESNSNGKSMVSINDMIRKIYALREGD